jgi:tetratricopeptide (TPR) repeat protein
MPNTRKQTSPKKRQPARETQQARSLGTLAEQQVQQGRLDDAARLYRQALRQLGSHPGTKNDARLQVRARVALADIHREQGEYAKARPLLERALKITAKHLGPSDLEGCSVLNAQALLAKAEGRFSEAGILYQKALDIAEKRKKPDRLLIATLYHNMGALEHACGGFHRGEPFARKALQIRQRELGRSHPDVAISAGTLAALLVGTGKLKEARRLHARILTTVQRAFGPKHLETAVTLSNIAAAAAEMDDHEGAEHLYRKALRIKQEQLGAHHPDVATTLNNLAVVLKRRHRYREAEELYRTALSVLEKTLGGGHPRVLATLENYAALLRQARRPREARALETRADRIREGLDTLSAEDALATATINPLYACFRLTVRPSPIHRWGVYAEERIPARRKVIEYTGERISRKEARRRWESHELDYLFTLDDYWCIDGASGGSGAEYINHSCDPNLRTWILKGHILYMSKRVIRPGEELSVDYRFAADTEDTPCSCGSPRCRGSINVK